MSAKKPGSASRSKKNSTINESFLNNRETCLEFLKMFKQAQLGLQADSEAVEPIIHAIEELGMGLLGCRGNGMGAYEPAYKILIPFDHTAHEEFIRLYRKVQVNRNEYVHQGASVRSFASQASKLANLITRELMNKISNPLVKDLMVENVIVAKPWYTLRKIRHLMLANGITALPYFLEGTDCNGWRLITDYLLLSLQLDDEGLNQICSNVFNIIPDQLDHATTTSPEQLASGTRFRSALPVLVLREFSETQELVGIIAPADIL